MARKPNKEHAKKIYRTIEEHRGKKKGFLARILGVPRSDITRALPALEDMGLLISEDEKGGLWPFKKTKKDE